MNDSIVSNRPMVNKQMHRRESLSSATPLAQRTWWQINLSGEREGSLIQSRFILNSSRSLRGFFGDNIHALSASVWSIPAPWVQLIWKNGRRHISTLLIHRVRPSHQNTFGCSIEAVIGDKASPTHLLLSPNIFFFFFVSKFL